MRAATLGPATEPPRVAFAVSRSVGGAVTRNRVRRRLQAAVREHAAHFSPGQGYLVRARPTATSESYASLSVTLRAILGELAEKHS